MHHGGQLFMSIHKLIFEDDELLLTLKHFNNEMDSRFGKKVVDWFSKDAHKKLSYINRNTFKLLSYFRNNTLM